MQLFNLFKCYLSGNLPVHVICCYFRGALDIPGICNPPSLDRGCDRDPEWHPDC